MNPGSGFCLLFPVTVTEFTRCALPGDVEDLVAIDASVNPSPWSADRFYQMCEPCGPADSRNGTAACRILAAEIEGRVVGFIVVCWVLDEGEIQALGVSPTEQGKGVGRSLVKAALGLLCRNDVRFCFLEVRDSNQGARELYEACGFAVDGVRESYYPSGTGREDAVLMSRKLNGVTSERA